MPKRRLPTHAERRERAQRRAQRHAELRLFGALARQELEQLASRVARAAALPQQVADERLAAQLDRLAAARAALELAEQLLQVDRDDEAAQEGGPTAVERQKVLEQAMGRWRRSSHGWWEVRWVPRPLVAVDEDRRTRHVDITVQWVIHGPYYYYHWREEGRKQSSLSHSASSTHRALYCAEAPPHTTHLHARYSVRWRSANEEFGQARTLQALVVLPLPRLGEDPSLGVTESTTLQAQLLTNWRSLH